MLASVDTANTVRMPITTTTTTVWARATACDPTTLSIGHHHDDEHGEDLDPDLLAVAPPTELA